MKYCKPIKTPSILGVKLEEAKSTPLVNNIMYRHLVGCIIYFNHTQPDIHYEMSVVSRHMEQPHDIHWRETKSLNLYRGSEPNT